MNRHHTVRDKLTTDEKNGYVSRLVEQGYTEVGVYDRMDAGDFRIQPCFREPFNPRSQVLWSVVVCLN